MTHFSVNKIDNRDQYSSFAHLWAALLSHVTQSNVARYRLSLSTGVFMEIRLEKWSLHMPREVFSGHEGWHQSFTRRSEIFIDSADRICVTKDEVCSFPGKSHLLWWGLLYWCQNPLKDSNSLSSFPSWD